MRLSVPSLEVDRPGLRVQVSIRVVDPVPWKRARSYEFVLRGAVDLDRQSERRPGGGRLDPYERPPDHLTRNREPGAAANGLHEAHALLQHLRLVPQHFECDPGD